MPTNGVVYALKKYTDDSVCPSLDQVNKVSESKLYAFRGSPSRLHDVSRENRLWNILNVELSTERTIWRKLYLRHLLLWFIVNAIQPANHEGLLLMSNTHRKTHYLALEDGQSTLAGFPHKSLETYLIWRRFALTAGPVNCSSMKVLVWVCPGGLPRLRQKKNALAPVLLLVCSPGLLSLESVSVPSQGLFQTWDK